MTNSSQNARTFLTQQGTLLRQLAIAWRMGLRLLWVSLCRELSVSKQSFQTGHPPPLGLYGPVFGAAMVLEPVVLTRKAANEMAKGLMKQFPKFISRARSVVANQLCFNSPQEVCLQRSRVQVRPQEQVAVQLYV